jgi:small basic protein (TIGR04137 family)
MSVHRSLRSADALERHRNVLTRAERIAKLKEQERWDEEKQSVFGLPKIAHRKAAVGGKVKKKQQAEGEEGAATPGAAPAAPK